MCVGWSNHYNECPYFEKNLSSRDKKMNDNSELIETDLKKRPFDVWIITIVDGLFLGVLPFLIPLVFTIMYLTSYGPTPKTSQFYTWLMFTLQWLEPTSLSSFFQFHYSFIYIGSLLVLIAAVYAWRGHEMGRILLVALASVTSLIAPVALALMKYENHAYGGQFDENGFLVAGRFLLAFTLIVANIWCFTRRETSTYFNQNNKSRLISDPSDTQNNPIQYFGISLMQLVLVLVALALPVVINIAAMKADIGAATMSHLINGTYIQPQFKIFDSVRTANPQMSILVGFSVALLPLGLISCLLIFLSDKTFFQSLPGRSKFVITCILALMIGTIFSFVASIFMPITWLEIFHGAYRGVPQSDIVQIWSGKYLSPAIAVIMFITMNISGIKKQKA
jgi:hypothetical protein